MLIINSFVQVRKQFLLERGLANRMAAAEWAGDCLSEMVYTTLELLLQKKKQQVLQAQMYFNTYAAPSTPTYALVNLL